MTKRIAYTLALCTVLAAVLGQTWLVVLLGLPMVALNHVLMSAKHRAELAPYGTLRPPALPARTELARGDAETLPSSRRRRTKAVRAQRAAGARP